MDLLAQVHIRLAIDRFTITIPLVDDLNRIFSIGIRKHKLRFQFATSKSRIR